MSDIFLSVALIKKIISQVFLSVLHGVGDLESLQVRWLSPCKMGIIINGQRHDWKMSWMMLWFIFYLTGLGDESRSHEYQRIIPCFLTWPMLEYTVRTQVQEHIQMLAACTCMHAWLEVLYITTLLGYSLKSLSDPLPRECMGLTASLTGRS